MTRLPESNAALKSLSVFKARRRKAGAVGLAPAIRKVKVSPKWFMKGHT